MAQQTLELAGDCRLMERILQEKDVSGEIGLVYEGNSEAKFRHKAKRAYNRKGYPLIHAQEIYSDAGVGLSESRVYMALNELVRQKKAETAFHEGLFWYSWVS